MQQLRLLPIALLLGATPVAAQDRIQGAVDPQIVIYRQLLDQANANLVAVAAQLTQTQARIKELEDKCGDKCKK